ncbi:MAG: dienelactone hydrolase family protein, partial [Alphaproteobacteria bacterium]
MQKTDSKRDLYIDLFDHYVHSSEPRRVFLQKLVKAAGGVAAAAAVLPWLEGTGAEAAMVAPNDGRLTAGDVKFGKMTAYVARPKGSGKLPTVVVIHENRGLTPHIRDVARRVALEGYLAVAPDLISPLGGTPRNEDKARDMQDEIKKADHLKNLVATAKFAASHANSNGKVGCVGFCRGG